MKRRLLIFSAAFLLLSTMGYAQVKVGGDRDQHGCIASAGYTYSSIKKGCIQAFTQKIKLSGLGSAKGMMAAVIFSNDNKKAEVFMAGYKESQLLVRTGKRGNYVWKKGDLQLTNKRGYQLKKARKLIYCIKKNIINGLGVN